MKSVNHLGDKWIRSNIKCDSQNMKRNHFNLGICDSHHSVTFPTQYSFWLWLEVKTGLVPNGTTNHVKSHFNCCRVDFWRQDCTGIVAGVQLFAKRIQIRRTSRSYVLIEEMIVVVVIDGKCGCSSTQKNLNICQSIHVD